MTGPLARHAQALLLSVVLALVIGFAYWTEIRWLGIALVVGFWVFVFCVFRLLWLGPILSGWLASGVLLGIYGGSKFKFWLTARRLHPYDLYTYANPQTLLYFKDLYPEHYLYLYVPLALFAALAIVVLSRERLKRPSVLEAAAVVLVLLSAVALARGSRYLDGAGYGESNRFLHFDHQHTSTFVLSAVHSVPELVAGRVFEYGEPIPLDPERVAAARENRCTPRPGVAYPNVVAVLRESIVIPSTIPALGVPGVDERRFTSSDGRTYRLRVETYGGGSAHTIFSLLTGLSTEAFGGMKNIAIDLTPGKVHYGLPFLMRDCGYRAIAVTTGAEGYVAAERFYRSLGFHDYFDLEDIGKRSGGDYSDRAMYGFLFDQLAGQRADAPTFAYVDTTVSHAPYTYALRPEETVAEAAAIREPEVAEYVRRLLIGERDLSRFMEDYAAVRNGRPLVVLDFGDHHPNLTRELVGHPGYVNEDRRKDDPHLITYFRIRSLGRPLAELPADHSIVDTAFLSDWLVRALDLPVEGIYRMRWAMVERCRSRYWQCEEGAAAHQLHQLMRASGLIGYP